jgi:glutamyl endopeptidase
MKTIVKTAATALGFALLATTAAVAAEDIISSDGTVIKGSSAVPRITVSPSFEGTGARMAGSVDSASEFTRLSQAKGIELGGRSVIGADGRVRVTATTSSPYRKIAQIYFKETTGGGTFICTGWFVNKNTIVTAGHCVHQGSGGSAGFYPVSTYKIYPGKNGSSNPYGSCTAKSIWTNTGWAGGSGAQYDYGAIKLNCSIGTTTGWFGYFWQTATLVGKPATVTGYPGDKPTGTMWKMSGSIGRNTTRQVSYSMDTAGGQSGSPVYYNRSGCGWCSMAIHAYGASGSPLMNSGTRITSTVYNFINTIKAK